MCLLRERVHDLSRLLSGADARLDRSEERG